MVANKPRSLNSRWVGDDVWMRRVVFVAVVVVWLAAAVAVLLNRGGACVLLAASTTALGVLLTFYFGGGASDVPGDGQAGLQGTTLGAITDGRGDSTFARFTPQDSGAEPGAP